MIKVFVPSYRRPAMHTTLALLTACGVKATVIVRRPEADAYRRNLGTAHSLMVIGPNDDLTAAREAARQTLKKDEWCLMADDNVRGWMQPKTDFYRKNSVLTKGPGETMITRKRWEPITNIWVNFTQWYALIIEDSLREAEKRGAHLVGFSQFNNPAFRAKKYADVGYVCGKTMLMQNTGLPWKQSRESSGEDYALTGAHLYEHGRVLINRWGYPHRYHYMAGGCGPYEERLPAMLRAQTDLCGRYGALFAIKNANDPARKQGELRIRFNSLKQVEEWRAALKDPNYRIVKGKLKEVK